MKDTKIFLTLIIFSIAVAFTGCSSPVGSLLYAVDYIKAVPLRSTVYGEGDWFIPAKDMKVIGVFGGVEDEIDIDEVEIKIIHDPGFTIETEDSVPNNQKGFRLTSQGPKTVVISYKNMEARYDIAVGLPGMGGGGWGDGEGSDIKLNWPD